MRVVLAILNPRAIRECMESLQAIPTDKVWVERFTEPQLEDIWPGLVGEAKQRGYTHMSVQCDDTITPVESWRALTRNVEAAPVVTGWCNLQTHGDSRANVSDEPLGTSGPREENYAFPTAWDVLTGPHLRRTYFAGLCLTTMSVEMWAKYPLAPCAGGYGTDYHLACRLQTDDVKILCVRQAFAQHVKDAFSAPDHTPGRELLIGMQPARIRWEPWA